MKTNYSSHMLVIVSVFFKKYMKHSRASMGVFYYNNGVYLKKLNRKG